jgi:signal transduction histidine kinase
MADVPASLDPRRLDRLIEVGRRLLSRLDLDSAIDEVLETARELTGASFAALGVLDESRRELAEFLTKGIDPDQHRAIGELPRGNGVLGLLITDPKPLRLSDVTTHPQSFGFPPGHPPMHTFLGVPIVIRGEVWGNLYLAEKAGGQQFTEEDEASVVVLADWAAIAIDNARLYERAEKRRVELERAVRGFEATAAIAQAVGGDPELARVLELIVKRGRALVEARSVVILLEEGQDLVVAAAAGRVDGGRGARMPVDGSTSGEVLRTRASRRVDDIARGLRVAPTEIGIADATTALLVPLVYRGRGIGVLAAFDRLTGEGGFNAEDEQVMQAFAASAAIAVATAQSVEADRLRRSLESAEHERGRWARELHDETLQGLGALKVMLGAAVRQSGDEARAAIDQAVEHVDHEIASLRGIIADLRPPVLDQVGLEPALETLLERTSAIHGLEVEATVSLPADGRLGKDLETTVYRLIQEGLTNIVKHASAKLAQLDVRVADGLLLVTVADDGVGFDPGAPAPGFGLTGMRERVQLAGGRLVIEQGTPGTLLRAEIPYAS